MLKPDWPSDEPSISASRECSISRIWIGGPSASAFAPMANARIIIAGCDHASSAFRHSRQTIDISRSSTAVSGGTRSASLPPTFTPTVMPTPTAVMISGIVFGSKCVTCVSSGAM